MGLPEISSVTWQVCTSHNHASVSCKSYPWTALHRTMIYACSWYTRKNIRRFRNKYAKYPVRTILYQRHRKMVFMSLFISILGYTFMKEIQMPTVHAANLMANSGNTTYGVVVFISEQYIHLILRGNHCSYFRTRDSGIFYSTWNT